MAEWIDLIDPTPEELNKRLPQEVEGPIRQLLLAPPGDPRPTLQGRGDYLFGIFLVAVAVPAEDRLFYQEVDVVVTHEVLLSVSKTPKGEHPYDPRPPKEACAPEDATGMMLYHLVDDIAERYLQLVDTLDTEIDELEDQVETAPVAHTRGRIWDLRHDLLQLHRTLNPTRDAVRRVVDNVIDVDRGEEIFPRDVELAFNLVYDKLLRAVDELELSRDLLNGTRDYLQGTIANDQNEATKKLTALASILLVPTFIVGVYGQNFDHMPELHWHLGYLYSWLVIIVVTAGQIVYFRRRGWI